MHSSEPTTEVASMFLDANGRVKRSRANPKGSPQKVGKPSDSPLRLASATFAVLLVRLGSLRNGKFVQGHADSLCDGVGRFDVRNDTYHLPGFGLDSDRGIRQLLDSDRDLRFRHVGLNPACLLIFGY